MKINFESQPQEIILNVLYSFYLKTNDVRNYYHNVISD